MSDPFFKIEFYPQKLIDFESLMVGLHSIGYHRQAKVAATGDYSVKGSIIDIFAIGFSLPVRVELNEDRVESIHTFEPESGRLIEPHQMVIVLPMRRAHHKSAAPNQDLLSATLEFTQLYSKPLDPFVDIHIGDYVVHVLHGIARYRGLKPMQDPKSKKTKDFFALEYQQKNILYVPVEDIHLLQRYVAFGKSKPELSRLGGKRWEMLKEATRKGVQSFAADILALQAKRKALKGFAFAKDDSWQEKLEKNFPYKETPDQLQAIEQVKKDMQSTMPMDRLLCGDVGYGKTEVALRAAFKAVMSGKQVAFLVPTTLLAEQHYLTFQKRLEGFPVSLRMLSRFCKASEQAQTLRMLSEGSCDMVIGTHRLLSNDVQFKDLGLVIIDEEQRFGVAHKEHLKTLRLLVDVLTLSATPIPRTLYMSLLGARDMSTIHTPPVNRKPIKTIVKEFDEAVLRQAIDDELRRSGQVFYLYNRVETIDKVAARIAKLCPKARLAVAHGQMPALALEHIMKEFIGGRIDVLVCTTIVESGIDIPNANTLIVERADLFGLSELYQLRGRVGRSDRQAFAYFLVPKNMFLSLESEKRLRAIEKFNYMGSGFNLAMEDLEIRGAGNILGVEQHGHIVQVGFDLYCRILRETVLQLSQIQPQAISASSN